MNYLFKLLIYSSILSFASCINYKHTLFFNGDQTQATPPNPATTYKLVPGDVFIIRLFTPDTKSAEMFNLNNQGSGAASPQAIYFNGYSVNDSGYVELPIVGNVYVKGYTIGQVDSVITKAASEYFTYFTLEVKLGSFKITALGEVKSPGVKYIYNDKCTIFEAVGFAGDLTDLADRSKVKVVRKIKGVDMVYKVNLTDYSVYNSEAYNIQPNDVIYVKPQKAKVDSKNITYVSFGLSLISILFVIKTYLKF